MPLKNKNTEEITVRDSKNKGEIVLYQPDHSMRLDVLVENETVWLTQMQMVVLFGRSQPVISRHISNIFKEEELDKKSNMHFLHIANADRPTAIYNLDVIISVGYRVKSKQGTHFRQWANSVLKEYILRGHVVSKRFERLEYRVGETEKKIDFFVKAALPPREGIFYEGQIFDAYAFVAGLIKTAKRSVTLIDNYVDESTLLLLSKRAKGVAATVYTAKVSAQLQLDLEKHHQQYPAITVKLFSRSHDRFLFIDNTVYLIGASLKDLGRKLFAFSKTDMKRADVLR